MFQSLSKLFGPKKPTKQLVKAPPGQLFAWKQGVWIEATETTLIVLPGELIRDDEKIGSIVETSDDDVILGFTQSEDRQKFTDIRVKLECGQSAMIRRSAQALIRAEHGGETHVYITLPAA